MLQNQRTKLLLWELMHFLKYLFFGGLMTGFELIMLGKGSIHS